VSRLLERLDFPLPPPWLRVVLVLVFLGFGVFVGSVTNSSTAPSASARELRLVLPASSASASAGTPQSPPTTPPPLADSETTPEASTVTPPAAAPPTATNGSSGTHGSGGGKSGSAGKGGGAGSGSAGQGNSGGGSGGGSDSGSGSGGGGGSSGGEGSGAAGKLPPIKHIFVVMLADEPYAAVFGPASKAGYLAHTLEKRGELLVRYYAVAHDELANGVALISGQGPTAQTAVNCPTFAAIAPATVGAEEQVSGSGCVYPSSTQTLAGQLAAKHLTWRAYVEGMEGPCAHPTLGAADTTVGPAPTAASGSGSTATGPPSQWPLADPAAAGASYATFRNPFVYFQGILGGPACNSDDVAIGSLTHDLASSKRTPNFSYIVPSLCEDGSNNPCAPGHAAGVAATDTFLQKVVPEILASKAYKQGGLLVITVDQAPATGIEADSSSCCGQPRFAALPVPAKLPGGGELPPSGGGQVGALLLSPYVKAGTIVSQESFNHFSLLRTIEDLFGLKHLGYAAGKGVSSFGTSLFEGSG
jgi:hypothetical protein